VRAHAGSVTYRISFEGRTTLPATPATPADTAGTTGATGTAGATATGFGTIGLGLVDSRGWSKTASALAITGVENSSRWTPFTADFNALPDATSVNILARLEIKKAAHALMEIRNLRIEARLPETFPAYPLLTTLATRSGDGRVVHLVVLNKSLDRDITTRINLENLTPASIEIAELAAPPESISGTPETRKTIPPATTIHHTFPACSMTAITLRAEGQANHRPPLPRRDRVGRRPGR
jgi:alpha-N-arabinofuranosidase